MKKYYALIRSLHLYFGLSISPFIILFGISVLVLNHANVFNQYWPSKDLELVSQQLPAFKTTGSDSLDAKLILKQLNVEGEIDWISKTDTSISFPVNKPGLTRWVSMNTSTGKVKVTGREESIFKATRFLHIMPGQHNARMRGNSLLIKLWRVTVDALVYIVLFVSVTGIFLWYFLKPERTLGLVSFGIGLFFLITLTILLL